MITVDEQGGVFSPIPGQPIRVVYSFGPAGAASREPMFTCPVCAFPIEVFDLLGLWNECRLLGVLPRAGGLLDQARIVRRSFVIFANEWAKVDQANGQSGQATAAALALKAVFGGK